MRGIFSILLIPIVDTPLLIQPVEPPMDATCPPPLPLSSDSHDQNTLSINPCNPRLNSALIRPLNPPL